MVASHEVNFLIGTTKRFVKKSSSSGSKSALKNTSLKYKKKEIKLKFEVLILVKNSLRFYFKRCVLVP